MNAIFITINNKDWPVIHLLQVLVGSEPTATEYGATSAGSGGHY